MASNELYLNTWYAKRIMGDSAASSYDDALLQTGANIAADTWIFNQTEHSASATTLYGIKYVYDSGNDADDALEYYGGKTISISGVTTAIPSIKMELTSGSIWSGSIFPRVTSIYDLGSENLGWNHIYIRGTTSNSHAIDGTNPYIEFSNGERTQYGRLIYTHFDAQGGAQSLAFVGNSGNTDTRIKAASFSTNVDEKCAWNDEYAGIVLHKDGTMHLSQGQSSTATDNNGGYIGFHYNGSTSTTSFLQGINGAMHADPRLVVGGVASSGTVSYQQLLGGRTSTKTDFCFTVVGNGFIRDTIYSNIGVRVHRSSVGGGFQVFQTDETSEQLYAVLQADVFGTTSAQGRATLKLGNSLKYTTDVKDDKNASGRIQMYQASDNSCWYYPESWTGSGKQSSYTFLGATSDTNGTEAFTYLILGNNKSVDSTDAHSEGRIRMYGNLTYYHDIRSGSVLAKSSSTTQAAQASADSDNRTHYLPNASGYLITVNTMAAITMDSNKWTKADWNAGTTYLVSATTYGTGYITDIARIARRVYVTVNEETGKIPTGYSQILLGNNIAAESEANAYGSLVLYGTGTKFTNLRTAQTTADNTMYLPNYNGTGYLVHTSGTAAVGGGEQPTYVAANGRVTETTYALKATVNNSTATYMAYYSADRAISGTSNVRIIDGCLNLYPANSSYREGMRIHPSGSWSDITLMGNTNTDTSGIAATDWFIGNNSGTFYITHAGSSSSSTGYIKASTENSAGYWQLYQRVGVNGISNTYNFYVNGTSYFNGNILLKANQHRTGSTSGINMNNSDIINLNALCFSDVADTFQEGIMFYRDGSAWECIAANSSGFFFRGGTDGTPALSAANANGTIFASKVWGSNVVINSNWIGFYAAAGDTTTRYGYIQANADRMYFRKENGTSTYAFDFNGYIYTSGKLHIASQEDVGLNQNGAVVIGNKGGTNIGIDDNEIMARNNSAASTLYINSEGGLVYIGSGGITSVGKITGSGGYADRTNGTATYLNYGASGLAASAITWLCCWNGYEIRAISKAEMANATDSAHKWVRIGGDTMTSTLTLSGGSVNVQQGHVWAGTNGNTSGERQVGAQSGAGRIYLYSQASTSGNRGIYGANNAGTGVSIFALGQNNYIYAGSRLYGAVWNDYAEFRLGQMDNLKPGQIVTENGDGTMRLATKRLQKGCKVLSDTYGFALGETKDCKLPIAVSGRVLVYCDTPFDELEPGDCVCSNTTGNVVKMTRAEIINYPDCIIGTVSEIPTYDIWHGGDQNDPKGMKEEVEVKGRIWIYVK